MSTIKIRLRFYLPHDMDLISLMISHEMDIVQAMYCAVTAFVKHDSFVIKTPPLRDIPMEKKRVFHGNLSLDSEKDQEVVELLECIEPGYRNNFLKNILRLYLFRPATEAFLTNPQDMEKFDELFKTFTNGKRVADAATTKARKKKSVAEKTPAPLVANKSKRSKRSVDQPIIAKAENSVNTEPEREDTMGMSVMDEIFGQRESSTPLPEEVHTEVNETEDKNEEKEDLTDLFASIIG